MHAQNACQSRPVSSVCVDIEPTSASIGKKNVHLNGNQFASDCAQGGIIVSGTRRPEIRSSPRNHTWKIEVARVVKMVSIPSTKWLSDRITYAPQIATRNTSTSSQLGSSVGWKMSASPTAIGANMTSHGILWPANHAMS